MADPVLQPALAPEPATLPDVGPDRRTAAVGRRREPHVLDVTVVMPTVGLDGDFAAAARRVLESIDRGGFAAEFVVVVDGPAAEPPAWLDRPDVTLVATGARSGPAAARNTAVEAARGGILFFVDADVELAPDALERALAAFAAESDLVGVFGAYDDEPAAPGLVSQFRNLLHHHTHLSHPGDATTFWTGCGAIRTANFLDVGGFDTGFGSPSVEDIDLGMRVTSAGGRIALDPGLRCKHLKRWTLGSMIRTDVFQRAVPWTRMLVARHELPTTLTIDWTNRACGVLAVALVVALAAAKFVPHAWVVAAACGLAIVICHRGFYRLCLRKRGPFFAIGAFALHVLFFVYSSITFGLVVLAQARARPARRRQTAGDPA
ncbi:MAG: glycosyltransferase family 2 protein [Planctomycetaceae bacterium]